MNARLRMLFLVAVAAAAIPGLPFSSGKAQTEATINVTAEISEPAALSIRLCDTSADFGRGLNSEGVFQAPPDTHITATDPGENEGEGVYYVWNPTCTPDLSIATNVPALLQVCGRQLGGPDTTPDVTIDGGDVGFIIDGSMPQTYADGHAAPRLPTCTAVTDSEEMPIGTFEGSTILALRIDDGIRSGTFAAEVLFSVVPQ